MKFIMSNPSHEILGEAGTMDQKMVDNLNKELSEKGSPNRYVRCLPTGKIDGRAHRCVFGGLQSVAVKKAKTVRDEKKAVAVPSNKQTWFILARNSNEANGYSLHEAATREQAVEIVQKHLGKQIHILRGTRLTMVLDIEDQI